MVTPGNGRGDDRGQLVVIAALMIALTVLGSVVLLNSVHSSPEVAVSSDASSLAETERSTMELRDELRTAFLATNASDIATNDNRVAFVDQQYFKTVVETFGTEYNELLTSDRAMVVNATYNDSAAVEGAIVSHTGSTSLSGTQRLLENAAGEAPLVSVNATLGPTEEVALEFNDTDAGTRFLNVTNSDVEFEGSDLCDFTGSSVVQVDLYNGTGEISTDDDFCGNLSVDYGDFNNVTLHNSADINGSTIEISAVEADCGASGVDCVDKSGIDLMPTFILKTADPSVTYEGNITVFEVTDS
ncbi:hypothetical protein Huta_2863 [Halorhabdus utahensis DSM 12940]|uniref:Uncharacterized protein n=1 Tax=Halorhabdus utahensis (strain DSM 12940 / JCM 11049 / AX-2) TaxID=519442 RepID=C7NRR9_HALUD|nr:hypothetical protein [Halorhabdus utahensis]ACV13024.1 hypothetical protein Huta_2863 [Halorhabdus utahensis DSM 12940]